MGAGVVRGGGAGLVAGRAQVVVVADEALVATAAKIALQENDHLN